MKAEAIGFKHLASKEKNDQSREQSITLSVVYSSLLYIRRYISFQCQNIWPPSKSQPDSRTYKTHSVFYGSLMCIRSFFSFIYV